MHNGASQKGQHHGVRSLIYVHTGTMELLKKVSIMECCHTGTMELLKKVSTMERGH